MRKKKEKSDDKTTVAEAVIVTLICIIVFSGIVFIKLVPYIGGELYAGEASIGAVPEEEVAVRKDADSGSADKKNIADNGAEASDEKDDVPDEAPDDEKDGV